jgi:uncharacterized protein
MSMELDNSFTVPVPPDVAWDVLLDVARIAPCMPGATVDEVDGDVVNGRIKVKVGPVSLTYKGTAKFTERDLDTRTVLVEASGKETRGSGTASATVRASLAPADGNSSQVSMHTTMNITGRPAQFGRGVMVEVAGKLVDQFARNLAEQLAADAAALGSGTATATAAPANDDTATHATVTDGTGTDGTATDAGSGGAGGSAAARADGSAAEGAAGLAATATTGAAAPAREDSLNLVRLVGPSILKRVVPVAALAAGVALLIRQIKRGFRRGGKQ